MVIELSAELAAAVVDAAKRRGITPDEMAVSILREHLSERPSPPLFVPRDEWEHRLVSMGIDCGVSLSDAALSREGIYD